MMTAVVTIFDTYKRWYQSIKAFSLLIDFSQMRLPWTLGVQTCQFQGCMIEWAHESKVPLGDSPDERECGLRRGTE